MKLSIQPKVRGKPKHGMSEMGWGWENIEVDSWEDAFELFTIEGYSQSCELSVDEEADMWPERELVRKCANFVSRQIILIDADEHMYLKDLFTDDFYNTYGAGFYTSPSHSDAQDKFRVCFVVETPFTDVDRCQSFIHALRKYFYPNSDKNPVNPASYFNGTPNCLIKECRNKIIPNEVVDTMIALYDKERAESEEESTTDIQNRPTGDYVQHQYDVDFVEELLSYIQRDVGSLQGDYPTWITIAWATCGALNPHDAQVLMTRHWPTKSTGKEEKRAFKGYKPSQAKHTVATLVQMAMKGGLTKEDLRQLELEFKQRNNLLTQEELLNNLIKENKNGTTWR